MKISSLFVALCILLGFLAVVGSARGLLPARISGGAQQQRGLNPSPTGRKALSVAKESNTVLVAAVDGTVYLLDHDSLKPLWSFASGSAIYSSYQAPVAVGTDNDDNEPATGLESEYYIDCGDDWELYAHSRLGKVKLMKSLEEYVSSTPQIGEDGGIVLGSKQTSAFMVDGKTGRLINTYQMPNSSYTTQYVYQDDDALRNGIFSEPGGPTPTEMTTDVLPLYFTRTDYTLTSFAPNSNKVLWNLTVAEIAAASLCQDTEDSFDGAILDSGSSKAGFNMPLPCQSRALVYRSQNEDILEALSGSGQLTEDHPRMMLPPPVPRDSLPPQPNVDRINQIIPSTRNVDVDDSRRNYNTKYLPSAMEDAEISLGQKSKMPSIDGLSGITVIFTAIFGGFVAYLYPSFGKTNGWVQLFRYKNPNTLPVKKKKPRKSGKNGNNAERRDKEVLWDGQTSDNSLLDGRKIGKLFVSNKEIAKGSNGTVVLEGTYEGRVVAVKRLVKSHHEVAFQEIKNLIASDRHPNIVRYYGEVQDQDFVYLSLERCVCNLNDLIYLSLGFQKNLNHDAVNVTQNKTQMDSVSDCLQEQSLSTKNGYPSDTLSALMRDVVAGLVHLHKLGIIHRDVKPQNILITLEKNPKRTPEKPQEYILRAKLSDMGISKCLVGDMSSLTHHGTGNGSSGWQAPEQLRNDRQTREVDMFSLGCVLFHCMTGGKHPFGNQFERDFNILKNQVDLFLVDNIPEALDLFPHILNPRPKLRPEAVDVLAHPLFWSSKKRLKFLQNVSDRVELEDRVAGSKLLTALESTAPIVLGGKWNEKVDQALIDDLGRFRRYNYESVRDLLRVIRNKSNHYNELPPKLQELLGETAEVYEGYFRSRFPNLLMEVYKVLRTFCKDEDKFKKYY